jgi:phosphotransferase system HPr (HPr) family protein
MVRKITHVRSERGLHARPSAEVVKTAGRYQSKIYISNPQKGVTANARFILEVMMLIAEHKTELIIEADGPDAHQAAGAVAAVINEFCVPEEEV